ncbi:disease resistance protein RPM1-like [Salvia hispanica]|uniref:disease resistance protein RPM1-like n=1 Tax=Salvia hispanica TaxID=49212 RepID=UPI00200931DC|nr:disease resistance protein RPM1-like [Salvia hispanica]
MITEASATYLYNKIDNFVTAQVELRGSLDQRINDLKSEHELITEVLKGADALKEPDSQFRVWIKQLRSIYLDIGRVIGMYTYRKIEKNATPWYSGLPKMRSHDISDKIDDIEKRLKSIKEKKERYPVSTTSTSTSAEHQAGIAPLYTPETEIVGIEEPRKELANWVLDFEQVYRAMFVVGMGGSGKTALVKVVYEQLKVDFDCHVWLTASMFEQMGDLLSTMYNKLSNRAGVGQSSSTSPQDLIGMLRSYLIGKRYLIVLDNWNRNDWWRDVRYAFPNCNNSRVIITTTRGDIASLCRDTSTDDIYKIPPLPLDKARELFCREAFPESGMYPLEPHLREVSERLLIKCEGLPLAIVEMGKHLSRKERRESIFKKVESSLQDELERELSSIQQVLLSGYHDLPYHLQRCFLYMGMFPEDQQVNRRMLIRLLIAEDFIERRNQTEPEDIGEGYLKELMERNLVEASEMEFDGRPRTFRLHNFMHKIVLSKAKDEQFCLVTGEGDISEKVQRISIQTSDFNIPDEGRYHIRTFFSASLGTKIPRAIIPSMILLKILHLDHAILDVLPKGIKELLLLKYLSLRNTNIKQLPISTGRLKLLETLNLKQTLVTSLPKSLLDLQKLRHLLVGRKSFAYREAFDAVHGVKVHEEIGSLTNLQNLSFVRAESGDGDHKLILGLQNLKKLRKLGIVDLPSSSGSILCKTIQMLTSLRSLSMKSSKMGEILNIQEINKPPHLQRLYLWGSLERMPSWIAKLDDLVRIRLKWSRLPAADNPITILGKLNNLLELQLLDAYTGNMLEFCGGTFLKLKILELNQMEQLQMIKTGKGALPGLQKLSIILCPKLRDPTGIANIPQLKELHFREMPQDYVNPLLRNGPLHHVVGHVRIRLD